MLEFAIETMPNENGDENASVRASQTAQKEYLDELSQVRFSMRCTIGRFFKNVQIQENDALRAENEDMSNKLADIAEVTADINFTVQDYVTGKMNEKMQLEIRATLIEMVHKVGSMTGYDVDMRNPMGVRRFYIWKMAES